MKSKLLIYSISEIFNLFLIYFFGVLTIESISEGNHWYLIHFSCFSIYLNETINRMRNFKKYYPNFESEWLDLF